MRPTTLDLIVIVASVGILAGCVGGGGTGSPTITKEVVVGGESQNSTYDAERGAAALASLGFQISAQSAQLLAGYNASGVSFEIDGASGTERSTAFVTWIEAASSATGDTELCARHEAEGHRLLSELANLTVRPMTTYFGCSVGETTA